MSEPGEMLTYSCDADQGIHRYRRGRGFTSVDHRSERITDPETLARIRSLAVPPAWTDAWICVDATGHVQATGRDAKNRKQYLSEPPKFSASEVLSLRSSEHVCALSPAERPRELRGRRHRTVAHEPPAHVRGCPPVDERPVGEQGHPRRVRRADGDHQPR